jgi:CheY-like chemotaxis protein
MPAEPVENGPLKLLVVEDNPRDVELIRAKLEAVRGAGAFEIESVDRLSSAVRRARSADVILLDLGLPDTGGLDAVMRLASEAPEIPFVVLTGGNDSELGVRAVREGAQDFLLKDEVDGTLLDRSLRYAIERKRAEQALARLAAIMGAICYDCGRKVGADRPARSFES